MSNHNQTKLSLKRGFTLVEMLIIAPIVILVIGVFVSTLVTITGEVLAVRGSNSMAIDVQNALDRIEQDVKASGGYLATNNITFTSPQGYDDTGNAVTGIFRNESSTNGTMLILNSYAMTGNPLSKTRSFVYVAYQPNACASTSVSQNSKIMINVIYFVKNNALWRRIVMPSAYAIMGCSVPWDRPSCALNYTDPFCKTNDEKLIDGIQESGFVVKYYDSANAEIANASNSVLEDGVRQVALQTADTIGVTIDAAKTLAGRDISQSGTIRTKSANNDLSNTLPATAPLNPIADWLATIQGDHYGNFYDLITNSWATVTRAGVKTIYDPTTQKIYDVPANKLAINPRSDGKSGREAVIEEARTNYLVNSYFATSDWQGNSQPDGYSHWRNTLPSLTGAYSIVSPQIYQNASAHGSRVQLSGIAASAVGNVLTRGVDFGTFAPGDNATLSVWYKGTVTGTVTLFIGIEADTSSGSFISQTISSNLTTDGAWHRATFTYSNLPATTSRVTAFFRISGGASGGSIDFTAETMQLEKGAFETSYIPTTTTTVTRNADDVTVPTTTWNSAVGSLVGVSGASATPNSSNNYASLIRWDKDVTNHIWLYWYYPNIFGSVRATTSYAANKGGSLGSYQALATTWTNGSPVQVYIDGTAGTASGNCTIPTGLSTTATLGRHAQAGFYYNGPIQRLTVYTSALSSSNVSTVTNAVKDWP